MLEVDCAVAKVLTVLRQGKEAQLAEIKRHVAEEKAFVVHKHNCLIPALALKMALLQYEKELQTSTKPETLPAAPAASSPAAEEVAAPPVKRQRVPLEKKFKLNNGAAELQIYHGREKDKEPQFKMECKSCGATCSRAIHKTSLGHLLAWGHLSCNGKISKHNEWKMDKKMLPHAERQRWLTWAKSHLRRAWDEQQRLRPDGQQDEPMELKG